MLQNSSSNSCGPLRVALASDAIAPALAPVTALIDPLPTSAHTASVVPRTAQRPALPKPPTPLTRVERALLQALRTGASNKALARQLGKSSHTVRNQLSTLFTKIGVGNRTQALVWLQAQATDFGVSTSTGTPASFDRFFGTSVLLPGTALPGTMTPHVSVSVTAADKIRDPSGADV
jgi:DNA-binding CsgD family transcriptional regulator